MGTKKICILALMACLSISLSVGCSQKDAMGKFTEEEMENIPLATTQDLPTPSGGLVLSVYTETITAEEIIVPIADQLKELASRNNIGFKTEAGNQILRIVRARVIDILLYQQARKNSPDNIDDALEKAVEKEVNQFVADYGGNYAEAQKQITQSGFTDWNDFRDYKKKLILTQSYISSELKEDAPITHSELLDYYELKKDELFQWSGKLEFLLIDIQIDETLAKDAAMAKAEVAIAKLSAGEDFADVVKQYSSGHRASAGGLWADITLGSLAKPYDILEAHSEKMEPEEISEPITTDGHIFIMKLISRKAGGSEPFGNVQGKIESAIRLQRQRNMFEEVVAGFIEQANIADMQRFVESCTETAYQRYAR